MPAVGLQDFCRVTNGFKWWFRLDLKDTYLQVRLSKCAQDLTIISTFNGCYKWTGMPQGLLLSGDVFDQIMESVLANCAQTVSVRDDILGGGVTRTDMLREYDKVLAALSANGLTWDPAKTQVGVQNVKFFGMLFTPEGMKPDPAKVEVVQNARPPTSQDSSNSFVCMVAWNDIFLERFAETVRPLRDLTNTKGKYIWLPKLKHSSVTAA